MTQIKRINFYVDSKINFVMPTDSVPIAVETWNGKHYLHYLTDQETSEVKQFQIYGYNNIIDDEVNLKYVDSFTQDTMMFHMFEVIQDILPITIMPDETIPEEANTVED